MKIIIPGGTGQVGTVLARALAAAGHEIVLLSRQPQAGPWRTLQWDAATLGPWASEIDGADVVINLAGRNVNCRYNAANRRSIKASRTESTAVLGQAIAQAASPPPVWLQASTATIYAQRFDAPNDEASGILGDPSDSMPDTWRFSTDVALSWEAAARAACPPATRLVLLRSAMIMSPDPGGIFATLLGLVRLGLGGAVAGGRQYVSWMHDADFVRAVEWLIANETISGPVNLAAPNPLPYADFMRTLRQAWGMPLGLPATAWMVEIGTRLLRTESELVLKSRRVVPGRLLEGGFAFEYPAWPAAVVNLITRYRQR